MASKTWRDEIGPAIASALEEAQRRGLEGTELRRFVREQTGRYRGVAGVWGLKIWREEFRYQVKGVRRPGRNIVQRAPVPGQAKLFDL